MCKQLNIHHSAYYKWLKQSIPANEQEDMKLAEIIMEYYQKYGGILDIVECCLMDLNKLKNLQNNGLKVNKSELARRLGKDRRTIDKYINGYQKSNSRNRTSQFDEYYDIIDWLLNDSYKVFAYKRVLWLYLKDNYRLECAQ